MQRDRIWTAAIVVALAALVVWSAWQRWQLLTVSPFPLGADGYFYPVQVRSLLEHGTLEFPAAPLTFWWMAPFAAVTDPITGAKLGAAIGGALIAIPAYGTGWQLTQQRGAGLVAAAVAASAATSRYLTIEFVKQGLGLTVALFAIWLALRAISFPTRRRIGLALAALTAAALTHKLAGGLVLLLALPAAFEEARGRGVLRGRRLLYMIIALGTLGVVVLILGLLAPKRFLSPGDLALISDVFTSTARWDAPALVTPNISLDFEHEAAIGGVLGLIAGVLLALRVGEKLRRGERAIAWGFVVLGVGIALPWLAVEDSNGLGFRLRVTAFVPLAICAALVASAIARLLDGWQRNAMLVALALAVVIRARHPRHEGLVLAHPSLVSALLAAKIPADTTVIVPEHHVMFMVAWYTRAPVSLRPERIPYARRMRLLPYAFIGMGSPLDEAIDAARRDGRVAAPPLGLHPRHRNGIVLVTEPTWDWLLASLPPELRGVWARWRTL